MRKGLMGCIVLMSVAALWLSSAAAQQAAVAPAAPAQAGSLRAPIPAPAIQHVLLIGWDGVQRHHLMELLAAGKLPNLARLIDEGSFETIGVTGHATDTKSGWTQILTGYDPDVTGVYSNRQYQPIPEGLSVFERAEKAFGQDNVFSMAVTGKAQHVGAVGPGLRKEGAEKEASMKPGQPFHNTRKALDVWEGDKVREADEVGELALKHIRSSEGKRLFAFVHFSDPDHKGHANGENSPEYEQAIIKCDEWLGKLVELLRSMGIYDVTGVYVVTDHGFDEGATSHRYAPRSWLATKDKAVISGGHMRDIAVTILVRFGIDVSKLEPAYPGRPLVDPEPFPLRRARQM